MLGEENLSELKALMEKQYQEWKVIRAKKEGVFKSMELCLYDIRMNRPNDRSELDRRYAIVITDFEKVMAYFRTFIIDEYLSSGTAGNESLERKERK